MSDLTASTTNQSNTNFGKFVHLFLRSLFRSLKSTKGIPNGGEFFWVHCESSKVARSSNKAVNLATLPCYAIIIVLSTVIVGTMSLRISRGYVKHKSLRTTAVQDKGALEVSRFAIQTNTKRF